MHSTTHNVYDKICSSNVSYSIHFDHPFNNNFIHFVQLWSTFPIAVACEHVQLPYMAWNQPVQCNCITGIHWHSWKLFEMLHYKSLHYFSVISNTQIYRFSSPFRNFQFRIFVESTTKSQNIFVKMQHTDMHSNDAFKIITSNGNAQLCHQ